MNTLKINYNANNLLSNNIGFILLSLGLVLIGLLKQTRIDLMSNLFGDFLSVTNYDIIQTIFVSLFILLCLNNMQKNINVKFESIAGANHFYKGKEKELGSIIENYIKDKTTVA